MEAPRLYTRTFLETSHDLALWMIQLADTKASILIAASAGLAGLLFLQPIPACADRARYVLLVAVGLALLSAGACLVAIFPRTGPKEHGSLLYYRGIRRLTEPEYFDRVSNLTQADADREIAKETWELAGTQELKYMWLRWAVVLFALALIPAILGLVWAHLPCG
jgi:hypothetical protein